MKKKKKKPEYKMTSINLDKEARRDLAVIMIRERLKMGPAIRYALRATRQQYEGKSESAKDNGQ